MGKYAFLGLGALTSSETQNLDFLHTLFKKFNGTIQLQFKSQAKSESYSSDASVRTLAYYLKLISKKMHLYLKDFWDSLLHSNLSLLTNCAPHLDLK